MNFVCDDGGRKAAGYKGKAGDCVTRSVAIASGRPYQEVYDALAEGHASQRVTKKTARAGLGQRTAREGIRVQRKWFKDYMVSLGFQWVPCMAKGTGCQVHLSANELPNGRLVVYVSKHCVAMIDGVIRDTHDPSRNGTRCVYGYWKLKND